MKIRKVQITDLLKYFYFIRELLKFQVTLPNNYSTHISEAILYFSPLKISRFGVLQKRVEKKRVKLRVCTLSLSESDPLFLHWLIQKLFPLNSTLFFFSPLFYNILNYNILNKEIKKINYFRYSAFQDSFQNIDLI